HTTANHPVVVAKQLATIAQMSGNRVGLNVVAGWNKPEYEALGLTLPDDHETRYGYAQEWFDIIQKLWTHDGPFDWEGKYFQLKRTYGYPQPTSLPPIFNAAGSGLGREFASRNANFLFTPAIDLERSKQEVAELQKQATDIGRNVGVLTCSHVICRPTQAEAEEGWQSWQDQAAGAAVDTLVRLQSARALAVPHALRALIRARVAPGHGGPPPAGPPEHVAEVAIQHREAGVSRTTLSFFHYADD